MSASGTRQPRRKPEEGVHAYARFALADPRSLDVQLSLSVCVLGLPLWLAQPLSGGARIAPAGYALVSPVHLRLDFAEDIDISAGLVLPLADPLVRTVYGGFVWPEVGAFPQELLVPPQAFPVGSIYTSVTGVDPSTELGYGTWAAFGSGRVLVGHDGADGDFDAAEETGGSKLVACAGEVDTPDISGSTGPESAHTHAVVAAGTNSAPVFTGAALATHQHEIPFQQNGVNRQCGVPFGTGTSRAAVGTIAQIANTTSAPVTLSEAKSAGTPAGTVAAPVFTGSAVNSGAGSAHTHDSGNLLASAPAFEGSPTSVVQPYIVCFFWKRTA